MAKGATNILHFDKSKFNIPIGAPDLRCGRGRRVTDLEYKAIGLRRSAGLWRRIPRVPTAWVLPRAAWIWKGATVTAKGRGTLRRMAALTLLFCLDAPALASPSQDAPLIAFDMPAQSLAEAIILFSRQSRVAVVAPSALVRDRRVPAIRGTMKPEKALTVLLAGSDLGFRKKGRNSYIIYSKPRRAAPSELRVSDPGRGRPRRNPALAPLRIVASEIVVTGSRIAIRSYEQSTPMTVISAAELERDAKPSIGDSIRELPSVGGSASPNNGLELGGIVAGAAGLDTVNLRQLGVLRTLILIDGQRVVQSNITGQVDLGTIPTALVERVDVVTGGASAAWGSDAVAGVVNLVLDKKFDGLRASADYGNVAAGDHRNYRFQLAAGTGFAGERGRAIFGLTHAASPDVIFAGRRAWNVYPALMENPDTADGAPRYVHATHVGLAQATQGGLIVGGPLGGTRFVGPTAEPVSFDPGRVSGPLSWGGDAEQLTASLNNLTVAFRSTRLFGYSSYALGDGLKVSLQLNYGASRSHNSSVPVTRFGTVAISRDNAFLPQSIKDRMEALDLSTIQVGSTNLNNLPTGEFTLDDLEAATVGIPTAMTRRRLVRGVLSLYGDLGSGWSWNAYYQRGESRLRQDVINNLIPENYDRAVDAVVVPAGNAAGIAPGTIACRSTLADPGNGCSPLNIFGTGVASASAIAYVNVKPGQNYQTQRLIQEVVAASAQGVLPIGLSAGAIALSFGAEERREQGRVSADPGAAARQYALGNFTPFSGGYRVREAFLETEVPLLNDDLLRSLNLNLAGRVTDYSSSGRVATWKVGLTGRINDGIAFRGMMSRDIRAPNLSELFNAGLTSSGSAIDPQNGQNVPIFTFRTGNPQLEPEVAKSVTAGLVLTPRLVPGLRLTADYHRISIKDAIALLPAAQVLARCLAGEASFCRQMVFDGPGGSLSQINQFPLNINKEVVNGLDLQLDYRRALGRGVLTLRLLGNLIFHQVQDQFGVRINYAGAIGPDNPVRGMPRARMKLAVSYDQGPASLTVQGRFIGAAELVKDWTAQDVDRNHVPAIAYLDLRGSWRLGAGLEIYGAIDNLLDQDPPLTPGTARQAQAVYYTTAVRGDIYDIIGRAWRFGVRLSF